MLLDFIYPAPLCFEEDDRPSVLKYVHYLYFSMLLSFITLAVVVAVSLATEEPSPEQVKQESVLFFSSVGSLFAPIKKQNDLPLTPLGVNKSLGYM